MTRPIVCRPPQFPLRRILHCPTCKTRRRFAGLDAPWYGPTWTCCTCGDSWSDGERLMRSNRRGWRAEEAAKAKRTWTEAGQYSLADHHQWLRRHLGPKTKAPTTQERVS